ncbi:MAG: NAD(P)-binding domain-containing protein, partial [bacterium]
MAAAASPLAGKKLGFIGAGNMAEALIRGVLNKKLLAPGDIFAYDTDTDRLDSGSKYLKFAKVGSNAEVLKFADLVVIAVKPQNVPEVLDELRASGKRIPLLITICAGVPTATFEKAFDSRVRVVRVMPNTPALIGAGAAALARGRNASDRDMRLALAIFQAVG